MAAPMIVGMNSSGGGAADDLFMRDLVRKGRWVAADGPSAYATIDPSLMDYATFFPKSLPSGATAAILIIFDGAFIGPLGVYDCTIDSRFVIENIATTGGVTDPNLTFVSTGSGTGQVTIGGVPRPSGWQLRVTGPFASLTAGQRGLKILPHNDAHPERLYSDAWRASMIATGTKHWRPMEALQTNSLDAIPLFTDNGAKSGVPSATIEALVQGCNDLGMGLTLNIPPLSTPGYRTAMYTGASALTIGTVLCLELANEIWNPVFFVHKYLIHQGWLRGLYGNGGNATKPACIGWTPTSATGSTPFDPDYTTTGGPPFFGRTTQALTSGAYIFGNVYGYGDQIFQVVGDQASGAIFPGEGNSAFVRIATQEELNNGKWRQLADVLLAEYQACLAIWTAAGHSAANLRPVINMQSGPTLGPEDLILSRNDNALRRTHYSVQQAPYWYTYGFNEDVGAGSIASIIDTVAAGNKADIEAKQHWVRDRRAAIIAATPAGLPTPGADCHEIYEVNYHEQFGGGQRFAAFSAFRKDPRTGINLKYAMTLHGRDNPGTLYQIFALNSSDLGTSNYGWGVYFYASEALSGTVTNPGAIALAEWNAAATSGKPTLDLIYKKVPASGTQTISVIRGPQLTGVISGVVREVTAAVPDIPFTLADGSPTVDVTYAGVAGQARSFTIVPQPGVFTVGSLSGGSLVTPPVDPPPVDPPIDPPAVVIGDQPLAGCIPGSTIVRIISKVLGV